MSGLLKREGRRELQPATLNLLRCKFGVKWKKKKTPAVLRHGVLSRFSATSPTNLVSLRFFTFSLQFTSVLDLVQTEIRFFQNISDFCF